MSHSASTALEKRGFKFTGKQDGLDGYRIETYEKSSIGVRLGVWAEDDWEVLMGWAYEKELNELRDMVHELLPMTPSRQKRVGLLTSDPK
jgi:hypothetical protein